MKKFLLIAMALVAFVACKKDDDKNALQGTSWEVVGDTKSVTMTFTSSTAVSLTFVDTEYPEDNDTIWGTYKYSPPNVSITIDGETETGVVNGNTMTLGQGEEMIVFTRK